MYTNVKKVNRGLSLLCASVFLPNVFLPKLLQGSCGSALDLDALFVLLGNLSSIPPKMNASGLFLSHQLLKLGLSYLSPTIWVPHLSVPGPLCG